MLQSDLDKILATRHDNGADFWSTPDGKLNIEKPISTTTALLVMSELKVQPTHEALQGAANLLLNAIKEDGRVKVYPKGSIYPCHMANVASALCRNGFVNDSRVKMVLDYLLSNRYTDGGWRCNKFFFGHGSETEHSNPGVTLVALDAFRFTDIDLGILDSAVETLLDHWTIKVPIGPCHYGMGTLFMQVEYPFLRYNLFYYVYVLSFYAKAHQDVRFKEALDALSQKLDPNKKMIVERPSRKLEHLDICKKGQASASATERYFEILENLKR